MSPIALLFITLALCLVMGVPVSFSIGISCMVFLLSNGYPPLGILVQRMVGGAQSFTMMSLPMFVFAGALMAYGSTPRLMRLANMLLGRMPGGLGAAAMATCGFFGAVSGSGVASTAAIGSIMGPEMIKQGYSRGITAGLLAAGGTMASIIPPSIVMVVYSASANVSIGDMFLAGFIPGVITILALITLNCVIAKKRGTQNLAHNYTSKEKVAIWLDALLPLVTPVIILGGVLSGILTATEASVIAALYAFLLAVFVYKEINLKKFVKVACESVVSSSIILFIIAAATPFGWIMATQNIPQMFTTALLTLTSNPYVILGIFFVLLLILGCFMETICIIILMTPILLPIAKQMGLEPVHFGIAMLMNLAVGGCTPPLSVCLFTSCRILKMRIEESFPDMWYVLIVVTLCALLALVWPDLSMFLVNLSK
ncbi:MAG: TRAP transporter large permease [Oscillospiraceae bacterium]